MKHENNVKIRLGNHEGLSLEELQKISDEYNERNKNKDIKEE